MGRELISRDECRAVLAQLRDDLESQRLVPVSLDLERVFAGAEDLSRLYTAKFLARSLDLLMSPRLTWRCARRSCLPTIGNSPSRRRAVSPWWISSGVSAVAGPEAVPFADAGAIACVRSIEADSLIDADSGTSAGAVTSWLLLSAIDKRLPVAANGAAQGAIRPFDSEVPPDC